MKKTTVAACLAGGLLAATALVAPSGRAAVQMPMGKVTLNTPYQVDGQKPAGYQPAPAATVAYGKYLTDMGDCEGCHNANGGRTLAGGQYMGMPFGAISTPNITSDRRTGMGRYTVAKFRRLMRDGIAQDGTYIYPAMPYPWYRTLSDHDIDAIYAYLMSTDPVYAPRLRNRIWFPFNMRIVLPVYNLFFNTQGRFHPDPKLTASQNHGKWIVDGLEHCGECHNNRNFLGNTTWAKRLQGGPITKWYAPSLYNDKIDGLGNFSDADLVSYFKRGYSTAMGTVAGPMAEMVDISSSKLPDSDLSDIVAYLRTKPADLAGYPPRQASLQSPIMQQGAHVYFNHCAMCHQANGRGIANVIPALDGNGMVTAYGPQDVLRVIYGGLEARGPWAMMPGVGSGMTDAEVVAVTNYVRQAWSNAAPQNASLLLAGLIKTDTKTLLNGARPGGCPPLAQAELKKIIADPGTHVADLLQSITLPTMLQTTDKLVAAVRAAAPDMKKDAIVNGLTVAYCPIASADTSIQPDQRLWWMTHFSERVYVQASNDGAY